MPYGFTQDWKHTTQLARQAAGTPAVMSGSNSHPGVQIFEAAFTRSLFGCGGIQLYLAPESLSAAITTAKSSEINVVVQTEEDSVEHALPEQFVSTYVDGRFVTEPVNHGGG